jgi:hypothetical protein
VTGLRAYSSRSEKNQPEWRTGGLRPPLAGATKHGPGGSPDGDAAAIVVASRYGAVEGRGAVRLVEATVLAGPERQANKKREVTA